MIRSLVFIFILFINIFVLNSQDIVTNATIVEENIELGEFAVVEFEINEVREDDDYDYEVSVDYDDYIILIKIGYDYYEDEKISDEIYDERIEVLLLLEGEYEVNIELVEDYTIEFDQTISLSTLEVEPPYNNNCYDNFIEDIDEDCPDENHQVCACNGQTYPNECEAYFEAENGMYYDFICSEYVESNSIPFECNKSFKLKHDNIFESYECSDRVFSGKELYLRYEHEIDGDSLNISFAANDVRIRLFLMKLDGENLECIAMSDNDVLELNSVDQGTYYIIVDGEYELFFTKIKLCLTTATSLLNKEKISISPKPSHDYFIINSERGMNLDVEIYSIRGKKITKFINVRTNQRINHSLKPGVYILKTSSLEGFFVSKMIVV